MLLCQCIYEYILWGDERKLQIQELTKVTSVSFTLENRGSSFKLSEIQWTPDQIIKVFIMFGLYASMCNEWCNCSAGDHLMHILIKSIVSILFLKKTQENSLQHRENKGDLIRVGMWPPLKNSGPVVNVQSKHYLLL